MAPPVVLWLRAFLVTCAIEIPLVVVLTRESHLAAQRRALLALFAQLMTHPLVWFVFPAIPGMSPMAAFVASELWAWLGEAAFYMTTGTTKRPFGALGVSAIANGASLGVGLLMRL